MSRPAFQPAQPAVAGCELCGSAGGLLVHSEEGWRIVRVDDTAFPAFYRVVCNHHVKEFSELLAPERQRCMDLVCAVERVLIEQLNPRKVNLAALGNQVAHLHWHVVARFAWDGHFPQPVWGAKQREVDPPAAARFPVSLLELDALVAGAISAL